MKKSNIFQDKRFKPALWLIGGLILGWLVFHRPAPVKTTEAVTQGQAHDEKEHQIWTCSMHPQIRMDKPGKCPICGMDLIPLQSMTTTSDADAVKMTPEAMKLAEVETTVVGQQNASKEVNLYGKVQADERRIKTQAAHVPGRIEELMISFTGETVTKGQTIARIYSPELVTAQEELLQAKKLVPAQPALVEAAQEKLRQWKLSDKQIGAIEQGGKPQTDFDVTANVSGIVLTKRVNQGDYVQQGAPLFEVADLSGVWVLFDAYESDLPWIKKGDAVSFTLESLPGQKFRGRITFIDPVIDPATRAAKVRVEVANSGGKLKPEMFVSGTVNSVLAGHSGQIIIPQSAVLWTGPRSVVYVKVPKTAEPEFRMREIELGPALNNAYVVLNGLKDGEEIVTNGTFAVDASAQLAGKPSMMNPEGNQGPTESMPGMNMPGNNKSQDSNSMPGMDMKTKSKKESSMNMPADDSSSQRVTSGHPLTTAMQMEEKTIKVSGNCDMCKDRIETAAKSVAGVTFADWSPETKILQVKFDASKTNSDNIQKAIARVGHDTEKYKAPDDIYKNLPECCLYRSK